MQETWTIIMDGYSHGVQTLPANEILIQASRQQALGYASARFGIPDWDRTSCPCCGPDFAVLEVHGRPSKGFGNPMVIWADEIPGA